MKSSVTSGAAAPRETDLPLAGPLSPGQTVTPWLAVVLVVVLFSGGLFG